MRRARRGDTAKTAIAHAEKPGGRLICTRSLPNFRHAKLAKLSLAANRSAQQAALAVRFRLPAPVDTRHVTFVLKAIVGATRARLVHEFYEITTTAWRRTTPQITPKTVKTRGARKAVGKSRGFERFVDSGRCKRERRKDRRQ